MICRNTVLSTWGLRLALLVMLVFVGPVGAVLADDPTPTPESLIEGLSSEDPAVRVEAIAGLAALGDPTAASALLDLLADPDPRLGLYAAQAIGALASPENLPILREGLNHRNSDVRWRTALILGEMGDPRAVPALARVLDDPEVLVHRTAAESLVQLGGPAAIGALVRALGSSKPSVVYAAKNGLLEAGKPAVTPLAVSLSVGNAQRRANAATLLGYIGDSRALPALRTAVEIDEDETVRSEAQWAIDQITTKASL
jgi:HEAT repeat protein